MKVEYRVREIKRFIVTRHHETEGGRTGGTETKGTYENPQIAYEVAYALCKEEHAKAGTPPDDPNFQYPLHPQAPRDADGRKCFVNYYAEKNLGSETAR